MWENIERLGVLFGLIASIVSAAGFLAKAAGRVKSLKDAPAHSSERERFETMLVLFFVGGYVFLCSVIGFLSVTLHPIAERLGIPGTNHIHPSIPFFVVMITSIGWWMWAYVEYDSIHHELIPFTWGGNLFGVAVGGVYLVFIGEAEKSDLVGFGVLGVVLGGLLWLISKI